jgi:hypothetical protein
MNLRVYGEKNGTKKLLFSAIPENNFKTKGIKTANENGYKITEIWRIGTLETRWADIRLF